MEDDSSLWITTSVAGILTYLAAIIAAACLRLNVAREAKNELFSLQRTLESHTFEYRVVMRNVTEFRERQGSTYPLPGKKKVMQSGVLVPIPSPEAVTFLEAQMGETHTLDLAIHCLFVEAFCGAKELWEVERLLQHKPFGNGLLERSAWEVHPTFRDAVWAYHPNLADLPGKRELKKPRKGYTVRWLRIIPKAEDLIKRRVALASNRLLALLLQSEKRMAASEARNQRQHMMIKDIWKNLNSLMGIEGVEEEADHVADDHDVAVTQAISGNTVLPHRKHRTGLSIGRMGSEEIRLDFPRMAGKFPWMAKPQPIDPSEQKRVLGVSFLVGAEEEYAYCLVTLNAQSKVPVNLRPRGQIDGMEREDMTIDILRGT